MPMFYTESGFFKAVAQGDAALVDKYFAHGGAAKWLKIRDAKRGDRTPLHHAVKSNQTKMIRHLAAAGADIEAKDRAGNTALATAAARGGIAMIEALLDAGADINAPSGNGSILGSSVIHDTVEAFKLLVEKKADTSVLNGEMLKTAIEYRRHAMAAALLDAGLELKPAEIHGVFIAAILTGNRPMAQKMIEAGADLDAAVDGDAPLHKAVYAGDRAMLEMLIEKGARLDARNRSAHTPRSYAVYYGRTELAQVLEAAENAHVAKNTTPLTAGVNRMPDNSAETWTLMGENQVAHVGVYPDMSRRLTHIFNFESRERLTITENLKTGAENALPAKSFDELEPRHLEKALAAYRGLGGKADDSVIHATRKRGPVLSSAAPGN